ncbi:MAG: DNA-binding MarR family transcriptional regulator [Marivirga sp.]
MQKLYTFAFNVNTNRGNMKLEDEIKQSKFNSERQKAIINIIYTANWISSVQHKLFKKNNLTAPQYNVLRILKGYSPEALTVSSIQERMLDKMSNASRLVDKLVEKGFALRNINDIDRRQVDVTVTDRGLAILEKIAPELSRFHDEMISIPEEEAEFVNKVLDKIRV